MLKKIVISTGMFLLVLNGYSQNNPPVDSSLNPVRPAPANGSNEPVYRLKPAVDIPVTAAGAGWSIYAFSKIYDKDPSSAEHILSLRKEDINGFDRWAADTYSEKAATASNSFFYGSMPVPLLLMLDKKIRHDAPKIAFLYLEAMSVTGLLYTSATYFVDRYRPLAYNPAVPLDERTSGNARNSFFAGHVALVGTSTFFAAKVYADYHPDSRIKWLFYSTAAVATGATGYLRHRAGKHFPSDILLGTAVGTLSGILVPHFHKNKAFKNSNITVMPFAGASNGIAVIYKLK